MILPKTRQRMYQTLQSLNRQGISITLVTAKQDSRLRLGRTKRALDSLVRDGLLCTDHGVYTLTDKGRVLIPVWTGRA